MNSARFLPWLLAAALALPGCATLNANRETLAETEHPTAQQLDPWEPFNRDMHAVNSVLDKIILRPVAKAYVKVTPQPIRKGVTNFFTNLQMPVTTINLALQGKPKAAAVSLGRFALNLTLGLGGILDPATDANIPREDQDFGQTFAAWGWETSRYVVLPLFGPGTVRDTFGKGVATTVSPVSWLAEKEGPEFSILYGIDARSFGLAADAFLDGAEDEYLLMRDAYLQRRRCQIRDCTDEVPEYLLPDYDFEVPDFESMRR
jgi:phospholipid-binding lipoprotein MlaA